MKLNSVTAFWDWDPGPGGCGVVPEWLCAGGVGKLSWSESLALNTTREYDTFSTLLNAQLSCCKHWTVLWLVRHTAVAQVQFNDRVSPVQGSALFPGWPLAVCLQRLRVVARCQVCGLESKQPVPGHWQLWWKSKYTLAAASINTLYKSHNRFDVYWNVIGIYRPLIYYLQFFNS